MPGKYVPYAADERISRLKRVIALGEGNGIAVSACTCKNPEMAGSGCSIAGEVRERRTDGALRALKV